MRDLSEAEIETVAAVLAARVQEALSPASLPYPVWVAGWRDFEREVRRSVSKIREAEKPEPVKSVRERIVACPQYGLLADGTWGYQGWYWARESEVRR